MQRSERKTKVGRETSIIGGALYFEDARQCHMDDEVFKDIIGDGYTSTIRVISLSSDWAQNVYLGDGVRLWEEIDVGMTLRREMRSGRGHWYAYRRVFGKLYKRYVGTDEKVTQTLLLEIARKLPST